jgi:hypothetical protein
MPLVSLHWAAVSRSDSWDMDFYLLAVSGVSTRLVRGNQTKSTVAAQARRVRFAREAPAHHKPEDTGF